MLLVELYQLPQFVAQRGHEISFRRRLEPLDLKREATPLVKEVVSLHFLAEKPRSFLEVAGAAEKADRVRFQEIIVAGAAGLGAGRPRSEFRHRA